MVKVSLGTGPFPRTVQGVGRVSMEKLLNPYDREYMKMAMLKHEQTFKEQVHELHRLYHRQKKLMKNIEVSGSNGQSQERLNSNDISMNQINHQEKPRMKLDLEQPAEEYNAELDGDGVLEIVDESKLELTLGPVSYSRRKKAETPLTSDSGPSFSSSSTGSSHMKRTNSRTLKRIDTTKEESNGHDWGLFNVPDMKPGFQSGRKNGFHVDEQLRQERLNQPPWIVQVLSLNMT